VAFSRPLVRGAIVREIRGSRARSNQTVILDGVHGTRG
jgi:hypothetical protein